MRESTGSMRRTSLTPASEWVVAPAGYNLKPCTNPLARARSTSSGGVRSVR